MSWRGEAGGIEAVKSGHDAVMTPGSYVYLDHYQGDPADEPLAFGGFNPLSKIYGYEPVPADFSAAEAARILGVQGNIWTEYISNLKQLEYVIFPRIAAIAEVAWTPKEQRSWESFGNRLPTLMERYTHIGLNFSPAAFNIQFEGQRTDSGYVLQLRSELMPNGAQIRYTTDGSEPHEGAALYTSAIPIRSNTQLKAKLFGADNKTLGRVTSRQLVYHKALGATLERKASHIVQYLYTATNALADGLMGTETGLMDARWQPYYGHLEVIVDLGSVQPLSEISMRFTAIPDYGILHPSLVSFQLSDDGQQFDPLAEVVKADPKPEKGIRPYRTDASGRQARYIKIEAQNPGKIPAGLPEAGKQAVIATDEIIVH
jgi:hexosaminidase